tara:strand:+ start:179 stop:499 length:321 start_codon:yes stop_codon:yes gene_type:complete
METESIVKGLGAVKGTATGKAVEVDDPKFKEGDVLVAFMTTPDHIAKMKLASAFITEVGSITCHAAIVAREMGKPCIVRAGTDLWKSVGNIVTVSVADYKENSIRW